MLATSQPYSEIRKYLKRSANEDLASFGERTQYVDRYIGERVADLARQNDYRALLQERVVDILRQKAEGTFLRVGLVCEELRDIPSRDAV